VHGACPLVWALPFNVSYRSTNPIGWPKVYFEVVGKDWMGKDVIRG